MRALLVGALLCALAPVAHAGTEESPLRGRVVYVSDGSVYVASADGRNGWRLTHSEGDAVPTWSPDGTQVAFVRVNEHGVDLYVVSSNGRGETLLAQDVELAYDWSPDGSSIAFASSATIGVLPNAKPHIYVVDVATGVVDQVTTGSRADTGPQFSARGRYVYFSGARGEAFPPPKEGDSDIYRVNVRTGDVNRLTRSPGADFDPQLSPDGRSIAFASTRDTVKQNEDGAPAPEIYVMDSAGRNERRVTQRPAAHDVGARWSPTSTALTYISYTGESEEGEGQVRIASPRARRDRGVTARDEMMAWSPSWSSDGRWVAFVSSVMNPDGSGSDTEIAAVPADGGDPRFLTKTDRFEWGPDWH